MSTPARSVQRGRAGRHTSPIALACPTCGHEVSVGVGYETLRAPDFARLAVTGENHVDAPCGHAEDVHAWLETSEGQRFERDAVGGV